MSFAATGCTGTQALAAGTRSLCGLSTTVREEYCAEQEASPQASTRQQNVSHRHSSLLFPHLPGLPWRRHIQPAQQPMARPMITQHQLQEWFPVRSEFLNQIPNAAPRKRRKSTTDQPIRPIIAQASRRPA